MTVDDFPRLRSHGVHLEVLDRCESTNRHLVDNPGSSQVWSVVVTDNQTSGRGRAGRRWTTLPGRGLAVSVQLPQSVVPTPMRQGWLGWLSLIVGTALADAIAGKGVTHVSVKWPNDVLIDGKKVAGILGEITADSRVVVGMGVNLFYQKHELPTPESTSLSLHHTLPPHIADQLMSAVLDTLMRVMPRVTSSVPRDIREWVEGRLGTLDKTVRVSTPAGDSVVGVARGLLDDGSLRVQPHHLGSEIVVSVGDIEHLRHE
jgi:BirA family biotin operon repressor/biotin-[acetyl-CoA-carboxylase] ligase